MQHLSPAECALRAFGRGRYLAQATGIDETIVCRWNRPILSGGNGGIIPSRHLAAVLKAARDRFLGLTADDLIAGRDVPDDLPPIGSPASGSAAADEAPSPR